MSPMAASTKSAFANRRFPAMALPSLGGMLLSLTPDLGVDGLRGGGRHWVGAICDISVKAAMKRTEDALIVHGILFSCDPVAWL